jgi:hypothetical protein
MLLNSPFDIKKTVHLSAPGKGSLCSNTGWMPEQSFGKIPLFQAQLTVQQLDGAYYFLIF